MACSMLIRLISYSDAIKQRDCKLTIKKNCDFQNELISLASWWIVS